MSILIKNGFVYDPANKIEGDQVDLFIEGNKVVESIDKPQWVLDANGMVVMPGGVDIHAHIAGSKVNSGRAMRPEDHQGHHYPRTSFTRSGTGRSIPTTFVTGYLFSQMGYTTVIEAASPPMKSRHTHEELDDTPMIDKAFLTLLGNNWIVTRLLRDGKLEEASAFIAWVLNAVKGYGIKIVNPGGLIAWGWGKNVSSIDDRVPVFDITPREILTGLLMVNRILGMPHTIHVHTNNLGRPGNYQTTIDTIKALDPYSASTPSIHITHCQFNSYGGDSWATIRSGAEEVAREVNSREWVTIDMGQLGFTATTTMTADGPFQYVLYELTGAKWLNADVESETSAGIVPVIYRKKNLVNAVQWTIGLELALLIKDPWRVFMTTDHPNAAPLTYYPTVLAWLMSKEYREKTMSGKFNKRARKRSVLPSIDREYTLQEIAVITRAATARALKLMDKGHLGVGADGDVAVYDINPRETDFSKEYEMVRKAFRRAKYVVKGGDIVVVNGEVVKEVYGKTMWVNSLTPQRKEAAEQIVASEFEKHYSIKPSNYVVEEDYLKKPSEIRTGGF